MTPRLFVKTPWILFGLCALAFLCYGNVIGAPFVWDDEVIVQGNGLIRSFSHLPQVFTAGVFGGETDFSGFFRPLQTISYMFDYHFWQLNPMGYHLANIVLHAANALLVFWFVSLISTRLTGIVAAVFFVIHPVNTETVAYVSDRGDLLCFFFGLLAMNVFARSDKAMGLVLSAICALAATLAKEQGIVFPFLMMLYAAMFTRDEKRLTWASVMIVAAFCYGGIIFVKTLQATQQTLSVIAAAPFLDRLATVPQIIFDYVRLSVFPHSLHMEYHGLSKLLSFDALWYTLGTIVLLSPVWVFAPRKKAAMFWLLWAGISVVPFLQVCKPLAATLREHWLYLPLVGLLGLYAEISVRFLSDPKTRRNAWVVVGLYAVFFAWYAHARNEDWRSAEKLYQHDLKLEPKSFLLWNNVGVAAFKRGALQEAADAFAQSINISPGNRYGMAYNNLGYVYQLAKRPQDAEKMFVQSIRLSPSERAYLNLCGLYVEAGKIVEAERVLAEGLGQFPASGELATNLARVQEYLKKPAGK